MDLGDSGDDDGVTINVGVCVKRKGKKGKAE